MIRARKYLVDPRGGTNQYHSRSVKDSQMTSKKKKIKIKIKLKLKLNKTNFQEHGNGIRWQQ
jgi:stalled ribosome rescue protein Dom34